MTQTPELRFQAKFIPLLAEARLLINYYEDAVAKKFPGGMVKGDSFPESTVTRLMIGTTPIYEAAIHCLSEAATSLGAYALMRTLIETWAHFDFIQHGNDGEDEIECRAIRIDLGMAEISLNLVEEATTILASPKELEVGHKRIESVTEVYKKYGCTGPSRTYRSTWKWLLEMGKRPNLGFIVDAYKGASMTIHGTGWDWALQPGPGGTPLIAPPKPSHRAARFNHLVVIFSSMAQTALAAVGAAEYGDITDEATQRICNDRFIERVVDGDYD